MTTTASRPLAALLILVLGTLASCVSSQKAVYFNNRNGEEIESMARNLEPVLKPGDLVSITVSSLNPESSLLYNSPNVSATNINASTGSTLSQATGYLIGQDSLIQFPMLGAIRAGGMTKKQLADDITRQLTERKLLLEPNVTVRYLNFRVTVIGEVARPSVIPVPSEQINVLEAIGLAGDLTIFGRRDNVLLIREEGGKKLMKSLDLNSTDLLRSPYYYLKSNDILYVEPNKTKVASSTRLSQVLPLVLSGLSFTAIIIDRIIR